MAIFTANPDFPNEHTADPATRSVVEDFANRALEYAQAESPSKTFAERLFVVVDAEGVALISTWSLWAIIEFGSINNPPYAPIRRGIEAAGLQMTDPGWA